MTAGPGDGDGIDVSGPVSPLPSSSLLMPPTRFSFCLLFRATFTCPQPAASAKAVPHPPFFFFFFVSVPVCRRMAPRLTARGHESPYEILQIPRGADELTIKKA